jgi:hypothetical protein
MEKLKFLKNRQMKLIYLKIPGKLLCMTFLLSVLLSSCKKEEKKEEKKEVYAYEIESVVREVYEGNWVGSHLVQDASGYFTINHIRQSSAHSTFFSEVEAGVIQLFIADSEGDVDSDAQPDYLYKIKCKYTGEVFEGAKLQIYEQQEGVFQMVAESEH